jgi:hypothetical protein
MLSEKTAEWAHATAAVQSAMLAAHFMVMY